MKLLSDFDGVFTNQDAEAAEVGRVLDERVNDAALMKTLRAEVKARPQLYGWFSDGRISCYSDEDPYVFNNAVAGALYTFGPRAAVDRLVAEGFDTSDQLAFRCFEEGTERYRAAHASHVDARALDSVRRWTAARNEIVIVSNSSTDRIESLLRDAGIEAGAVGVKVRGGARKFALGESPETVVTTADFGGRDVHVRRPFYFEILRDERPDALIGDVLSLDVAMPAMLRAADAAFVKLHTALRRHPHTPDWALRACQVRKIEVVENLPAFVDRLAK